MIHQNEFVTDSWSSRNTSSSGLFFFFFFKDRLMAVALSNAYGSDTIIHSNYPDPLIAYGLFWFFT